MNRTDTTRSDAIAVAIAYLNSARRVRLRNLGRQRYLNCLSGAAYFRREAMDATP